MRSWAGRTLSVQATAPCDVTVTPVPMKLPARSTFSPATGPTGLRVVKVQLSSSLGNAVAGATSMLMLRLARPSALTVRSNVSDTLPSASDAETTTV